MSESFAELFEETFKLSLEEINLVTRTENYIVDKGLEAHRVVVDEKTRADDERRRPLVGVHHLHDRAQEGVQAIDHLGFGQAICGQEQRPGRQADDHAPRPQRRGTPRSGSGSG